MPSRDAPGHGREGELLLHAKNSLSGLRCRRVLRQPVAQAVGERRFIPAHSSNKDMASGNGVEMCVKVADRFSHSGHHYAQAREFGG